jgi:ribosomal protection tetracycline resistance protein
MRTLNLGVLAHVDAGKTSLTERLLYEAGVLDALGSVDAGTTATDTLALERARGITIDAAVVSFAIGDVVVNLVDTPGHPDFVAEVERSLGVLDAAILVLSAVEGVQPHTRVLFRALRRLGVPTMFFVNKVDRMGGDPDRVLREVTASLSADVVALTRVVAPATRAARVVLREPVELDADALELLTRSDDGLLARWVGDPAGVSSAQLHATLGRATRSGRVHPVLCGSALTGAGMDQLTAGLVELFPTVSGDPGGPLSAVVFGVDPTTSGRGTASVRVFSGTLAVRDRPTGHGRVTSIRVYDQGGLLDSQTLSAGRVGLVRGLDGVRIGDGIGRPRPVATPSFAPPGMETVVEPVDDTRRGALLAGLAALSARDPFLQVRQDDVRREIAVSLYGEVQKEVLAARLADGWDVAVTFRDTTVVCIEQLTGTGEAAEFIATSDNPYLATVGLRIAPAAPGSGLRHRLAVEPGSLPAAFHSALRDGVRDLLSGGGPHGWPIPDAEITVTRSGYWARQSAAHATFDKAMSSVAADFRSLARLVLAAAVTRAGTEVCEPVHRALLDLPGPSLGPVLTALARIAAVPGAPEERGGRLLLPCLIPAVALPEVLALLPGLTSGDGSLESTFDHYAPTTRPVADRARIGPDPFDRAAYLRAVTR